MEGSVRIEGLDELVGRTAWYQSIPLPGDLVTAGSFDTLDELEKLPFPESLTGKRCLDVATADGFWAFEMERRGASEVFAIDVPHERLDWPGAADVPSPSDPPRNGFAVARDALDSRVRQAELSVYDLCPEEVGAFDFVFAGSLLAHLRDPVAALRAIGSVLRGELLSVDAISLPLTLAHPRKPVAAFAAESWPLWWVPNLAGYRSLVSSSGLQLSECGRPFFLKRGPRYTPGYGDQAPRPRLGGLMTRRRGNLHAWVKARPPAEAQPRERSQ